MFSLNIATENMCYLHLSSSAQANINGFMVYGLVPKVDHFNFQVNIFPANRKEPQYTQCIIGILILNWTFQNSKLGMSFYKIDSWWHIIGHPDQIVKDKKCPCLNYKIDFLESMTIV